ncbi:hypothetical protein TNCV_223201 [Trichonephila clavipes]|nr:hypothetical protein TNCV_223201 [Trichonephila clavipes]
MITLMGNCVEKRGAPFPSIHNEQRKSEKAPAKLSRQITCAVVELKRSSMEIKEATKEENPFRALEDRKVQNAVTTQSIKGLTSILNHIITINQLGNRSR